MKLVTMILTVVALAACNVKGPGAGKAKGDEGQVDEVETEPIPGALWGQFNAWQETLYFVYRIDFVKGRVSIREINKDGAFGASPTSDKCSDHFDGLEEGSDRLRSKEEEGKEQAYYSAKKTSSRIDIMLVWNKDTGRLELPRVDYMFRNMGWRVESGFDLHVGGGNKDYLRSLLDEGEACVPRYYVNCMPKYIKGVVAENGEYTCDAINTAWSKLSDKEQEQARSNIKMDTENCAKDTEEDELCADALDNDNCCLMPEEAIVGQ